MATLNLKNFPEGLYNQLKVRAAAEHRSVAQEVTAPLSAALEVPTPLSSMELQGLGKELWHDIDAAAHVEAERGAWD